MKDLASLLDAKVSIAAAQYTATATGDEVDMLGFESATILVYPSAIATADASNLVTFTLTEATTTGGTFTAVDSGDYISSGGWDRLLNATGEAADVYIFGYKRSVVSKRFIKVVGTETGTTDATYSAVVVLGHPIKAPISA